MSRSQNPSSRTGRSCAERQVQPHIPRRYCARPAWCQGSGRTRSHPGASPHPPASSRTRMHASCVHAEMVRDPGALPQTARICLPHHPTNTTSLAALRPEGLRHSLPSFPLHDAGTERQEPYRFNLGMRRLPLRTARMDCRPPVPDHPRPGRASVRIAGSRYGTDSLMSRAHSPSPACRRSPSSCLRPVSLGRDAFKIIARNPAGITFHRTVAMAQPASAGYAPSSARPS